MTSADRYRLAEARLRQAASPARSGRPARKSRGDEDRGGPVCPGDESHGTTYLSADRLRFFCVHQSHDLTSRAIWPNTPES